MRRSFNEKVEIIRIVEQSEVSVKRTLQELDIKRSTFYQWYKQYKKEGYDGLKSKVPARKHFWNKIPENERQKVVEAALEKPELSPRELACYITDTKGWFISESSVYRILKKRGLITSPAYILMQAADEFKDKTTAKNQQWQIDFTYFRVVLWGWYFLATVMDDYSRYIIAWELGKNMKSADSEHVMNKALAVTGLSKNNRPRLLSDNGSCFVAKDFAKYLDNEGITHVKGAPYHPQTQGKIERYHRTMKNVVKLENYYAPEDLRQRIGEFVDYYNNQRYHESLGNITPADVYFGRASKILDKRKQIKQETLRSRRKNFIKKRLIEQWPY